MTSIEQQTHSVTDVASIEKPNALSAPAQTKYRLYKRRFTGLFGFVILGVVTGMPWSWFGPISSDTSEDFDISINQVNWLGNIVSCVFLPVSLLIPVFCSRFGIRRCAEVGAVTLLASGWVRYAGTISSLSSRSAYALLIIGQVGLPALNLCERFYIKCLPTCQFLSAISQPIFQVLGPKYSENWFDLKGRTTATMIIAIANPIGAALGQLLSPLVGTSRQSILVLAIISTAATPALFFICDAPPLPPTYAGSKPPLSLASLCRAVLGQHVSEDAYMSPRERADFVILSLLFGVLIGATDALSVLSGEWFEPAGYASSTSGLMGATLLLSGILASVVTAPLFDRVFTYRLGATLKVLVPVVAFGWLSLIWAIRPNNTGALFAVMAIIGTCAVTMLPVGLELGVELTRNADGSAAILWCSGNLFGIILVLVEGALRAPATANPPYNMHNALILNGTVVMAFGVLVFFIRARQARRALDEVMAGGSPPPSAVMGRTEMIPRAPEMIDLVPNFRNNEAAPVAEVVGLAAADNERWLGDERTEVGTRMSQEIEQKRSEKSP
ncbi:MFS general substrate transporter [Phlebopus sp. FC_14]|nr:MFS general substrate transporter [Phlebopus sp. FC_14]